MCVCGGGELASSYLHLLVNGRLRGGDGTSEPTKRKTATPVALHGSDVGNREKKPSADDELIERAKPFA